MAVNFLIASATALGSAIVLLSFLFLCLKLLVPRAFNERISTSASELFVQSRTLEPLLVTPEAEAIWLANAGLLNMGPSATPIRGAVLLSDTPSSKLDRYKNELSTLIEMRADILISQIPHMPIMGSYPGKARKKQEQNGLITKVEIISVN